MIHPAPSQTKHRPSLIFDDPTFDPTEDHLKPNLQGFRLDNGEYIPLVWSVPGRLFSQVLGLEIVSFGKTLRFFDPVRRVYLDDFDELTDLAASEASRAEAEASRAEAEASRAAEAEAENARLRAIIAQLTQKAAPTNGSEEDGETA